MTRTNPFRPIYNQQNDVTLTAEQCLNKHDFPIAIDIELTNHCNFSCRMCYTGSGDLKRTRGYMTDEIWARLMEELAGTGIGLRFTGCGEPMLHPRFIEYVEEAKRNGLLAHITTNASLMTPTMMDRLISANVDSIKYSFQGVDKEGYNEMRRGGSFDKLLSIMQTMSEKRTGLLPYLHIATTTTFETQEQIQKWKDTFSPYVDYISAGITMMEHFNPNEIASDERKRQYAEVKDYQHSVYADLPHYKACPEVFDKLNVFWNGDVSPCCNDYEGDIIVGNMMEASLTEIWNCKKLKNYREILANKDFDKIPLCKECVDAMMLHNDNRIEE